MGSSHLWLLLQFFFYIGLWIFSYETRMHWFHPTATIKQITWEEGTAPRCLSNTFPQDYGRIWLGPDLACSTCCRMCSDRRSKSLTQDIPSVPFLFTFCSVIYVCCIIYHWHSRLRTNKECSVQHENFPLYIFTQ